MVTVNAAKMATRVEGIYSVVKLQLLKVESMSPRFRILPCLPACLPASVRPRFDEYLRQLLGCRTTARSVEKIRRKFQRDNLLGTMCIICMIHILA